MDYKKEIERLESERDVLQKRMAEYNQAVSNIQVELLKLEGEHRFCVRQEGILKDQGEGDDKETSKAEE
jgi:hypothetical protein